MLSPVSYTHGSQTWYVCPGCRKHQLVLVRTGTVQLCVGCTVIYREALKAIPR